MGSDSKIEWTDHTFNPWMGCVKVSPACQNCYAERDMDNRLKKVQWGPKGTRVKTSPANWAKPIQWNHMAKKTGIRKRVFCASLADVFEAWHGPILSHGNNPVILAADGRASGGPDRPRMTMDDVRRELFELIKRTPWLDWLVLTKRPENVAGMLPNVHWENIWLGTSIESQKYVDERLPFLHHAKRHGWVDTTFVSAEPLVGPIELETLDRSGVSPPKKIYNHLGPGEGLDWVITGGESGPNARPADPAWFRDLRDQCQATGTPFLFKQWGEWIPYERTTEPMIQSQHGDTLDSHELPDGLINHERSGDWLWVHGHDDALHRHVGKKAAGRLLDGVEHNGTPFGGF